MPGMIKLSSISSLALAAALLTPGIAHASELTPEQMAWYRAQMGLASMSAAPPSATNSVGDALIEWRRLTQDQTASFDRLSSSEERRVGQECVSTVRAGGSPYFSKKKN